MSTHAPWIRWFTTDWVAATSHLGPLEEGVYSKLIHHYYLTRRPLAADIDRLCVIARATEPSSRRAVELVAHEFFQPFQDPEHGEVLRHKRADEEMEYSDKRLTGSIVKGLKTAWIRHGDEGAKEQLEALGIPVPDRKSSSTTSSTTSSTRQQLVENQNQNQIEEEEYLTSVEVKSENSLREPSPATGSRCPVAKIVELYHELLPELPRIEKLTPTRRGYISQRWREDLPDLDHWRNFFAFVRTSAFLMGKVNGSGERPPFRATLEWLTKPNNFAKISEEKYHG